MNIKKLLIIPFLLFVFGVSYAFFQYVVFGENGNEIVSGQIYMKYAEDWGKELLQFDLVIFLPESDRNNRAVWMKLHLC